MNQSNKFPYTRHGLENGAKWLQRLLEILPGAGSLGILGGLVALAWFRPVWALVFLVAFNSFCICYLGYLLVLLAVSSCWLGLERHTNWMERLRALDDLQTAGEQPHPAASLRQRLSQWIYRRKLQKLRASGDSIPRPETIHHVVIVPVIDESREMLDLSLRSLIAQSFPTERTMVILAIQEDAGRRVKKAAWDLHREYFDRFLALYIAPHQAGAESTQEIQRAANVTAAARMAAEALRERDIPLDHAIVTCLEPSAVPEPQYLACVAWHFIACPRRDRVGFQPVPAYHGNVWEAPALARVLHIGASLFHLIEASDPEKLVTFSSHSMSFKTLVEIGYWPADIVTSDASLFWNCYLKFAGDYRIVPMQIRLWLDIPHEGSLRSAMEGVYREQRRWAWGIENYPIILRGFLNVPGIPFFHKIRHGFKLLFNPIISVTGPFIVFVLGWLPAFFATIQSPSSITAYNTAHIQTIMLGFVVAALTIAAALSLFHLPPGRMKRPWQIGGYLLSWLLLPAFSILLGALPGLGVQIRMMLAQYPKRS